MKDMQKHKSRTETAGAYATANSTSRSSQVLNTGNLHKNLTKSNHKADNRQ